MLIGGIISSIGIVSYLLYKYMDDILLYNYKRKKIKYIDDYTIIKVIGLDSMYNEILLDTKLYNEKYYKDKKNIAFIKVIYTYKGKQYKIIYGNTIIFPPYKEENEINKPKENEEMNVQKRTKLIKHNTFLTFCKCYSLFDNVFFCHLQ